jgi:hypothetical protein
MLARKQVLLDRWPTSMSQIARWRVLMQSWNREMPDGQRQFRFPTQLRRIRKAPVSYMGWDAATLSVACRARQVEPFL